jgi:arginine deiminase
MAIAVDTRNRDLGQIDEVRSETGRLQRVLVHRPGAEIERVEPESAAALLFDDVIWPELAREEHASLVGTLVSEGVEVLGIGDLLAGALTIDSCREAAVSAAADPLGDLAAPMREWLSDLPPDDLAGRLIVGATFAEAGLVRPIGFRGAVLEDFALPPLVNLMYVRDTSIRLGGRTIIGAQRNAIRARESVVLDLVHRFHPLFASPGADRISSAAEGGDVIALSANTLMVGVGGRTSAESAAALLAEVADDGYSRALLVQMPATRSAIHLDCLISVVDRDAVLMDPRLAELPSYELRAGEEARSARPMPSLVSGLGDSLGADPLRVVEVAGRREQWMLGANTLAIEPGRVIAFRRNERTNEALREAGIEVLAIPGEELSRGRGGPRCLTSPLARDRT